MQDGQDAKRNSDAWMAKDTAGPFTSSFAVGMDSAGSWPMHMFSSSSSYLHWMSASPASSQVAGLGTALLTPLIILAWYVSNIGILLLNKAVLSIYGFRFPVFLTFFHMVACTLLAHGASAAKLYERQPVQSRAQLSKIVLLACVFCFALVMGNASLRFLPVSFAEVIAATTPLFTAALSLVMLQERETNLVYATLVPVVMGVAIATRAEPSFHILGFIFQGGATGLRAFKSVLQGIMLTDGEKLNSMSLLALMSAIASIVLLPLAVILEPQAASIVVSLSSQYTGFLPLLALNACLAFSVNYFNFMVTKYTSALTLQVLGNAKGVVAVAVSVALFRNPVTHIGIFGYAITVAGVVAYSQARKASEQAKTADASRPTKALVTPSTMTDVESADHPVLLTRDHLGHHIPGKPDC